jgi:hypothetical protein
LALTPGFTVADLVEITGVPRHGVQAWLNDLWLDPACWHRVRPKANTTLVVRVVPKGGGLLRSLAFLAVAAAATVAAIAVPPLIPGIVAGTTAASLMGAGVGMAISLTGALLVNALIPVRPPKLAQASANNPAVTGGGRPEASPSFSLTAPRNDMRPWGPVPLVLGRHRMTPPYVTHRFTELLEDEQYVRAGFCWGYGPVVIEDVRIGDAPISQFSDVEIEHRQGYVTDNPLTLVSHAVFEDTDAFPIELKEVDGFHTRTTEVDTDVWNIDLVFPQGLTQYSTTGQMLSNAVNIQLEYRPLGGTIWIPVILPGTETQIPPANFSLSQAYAEDEPKTKASRVWVNTETNSLELMEQSGTAPIGSSEYPSIPGHARSLWRFVVTGDTITTMIQEKDFNLAGFALNLPGTNRALEFKGGTWFSSLPTFQETRQNAMRRTMANVAVTRGQYEVRVRRVTPDRDDAATSDNVFWAGIRSLRHGALINFPKPLALTAVRIRATNQLSGTPDQLNGIVTSILPHWNGAAWVPQPTADPAACFRAVLQGPASAIAIPDSELDLPALQAWSSYCQSKGLTFNMIRDFHSSNWDALLDICSAGRATIALRDGKWQPVVDELGIDDPPVQHFTPRNSWDFRSEKIIRALPHAFRMRYVDQEHGWNQAEAFAYRDGFNASNATLFEQLEVPGITQRERLIQQGRFHFAQAMLRPETYSFNCDFEHLLCHRGDRVRVTHDVPLWGLASGRVTAVVGQVITVDEVLTMEVGRSYAMRFRLADGTTLLRNVVTEAWEVMQVTLIGSGAVPAVGDLFLFGEAGTESASLVVVRIEPSDNLTARLVCVDESPGIHQADIGPITPFNPTITPPLIFRLIEDGEFEEGLNRWVFDVEGNMAILVDLNARHGRHVLRFTPAATERWARPNRLLWKRVDPSERVYVEAWAKGGFGAGILDPGILDPGIVEEISALNGKLRLALGWYTSDYYLYHSQKGPDTSVGLSYVRFAIDAAVPANGVYVRFQVGGTGHVGGNVWIDDVLGVTYVLPVVPAAGSVTHNNYVQMQDQNGVSWRLSVIDGWPVFDSQLTIGDQLNAAQSWSWIRRTAPNATFRYIYPHLDGTLLVSDTLPVNGIGSAASMALLDKWTWQRWDLGVLNDSTYTLVEAA